jgi:hypothetical protein
VGNKVSPRCPRGAAATSFSGRICSHRAHAREASLSSGSRRLSAKRVSFQRNQSGRCPRFHTELGEYVLSMFFDGTSLRVENASYFTVTLALN